MYDCHVRQRNYLFAGLIMFLKPNRFGYHNFSGTYNPTLARKLLKQ